MTSDAALETAGYGPGTRTGVCVSVFLAKTTQTVNIVYRMDESRLGATGIREAVVAELRMREVLVLDGGPGQAHVGAAPIRSRTARPIAIQPSAARHDRPRAGNSSRRTSLGGGRRVIREYGQRVHRAKRGRVGVGGRQKADVWPVTRDAAVCGQSPTLSDAAAARNSSTPGQLARYARWK